MDLLSANAMQSQATFANRLPTGTTGYDVITSTDGHQVHFTTQESPNEYYSSQSVPSVSTIGFDSSDTIPLSSIFSNALKTTDSVSSLTYDSTIIDSVSTVNYPPTSTSTDAPSIPPSLSQKATDSTWEENYDTTLIYDSTPFDTSLTSDSTPFDTTLSYDSTPIDTNFIYDSTRHIDTTVSTMSSPLLSSESGDASTTFTGRLESIDSLATTSHGSTSIDNLSTMDEPSVRSDFIPTINNGSIGTESSVNRTDDYTTTDTVSNVTKMHDVTPSMKYDVRPSMTYDVTPSMTYDVTPSITNDITPSMAYDVIPSMTYDVTSSMTHDETPSMKYDVRPSMTYDVTSSMKYDVRPSMAYDVTPSMTYDVTSSITHDVTPSMAYDVTPSMAYDVRSLPMTSSESTDPDFQSITFDPAARTRPASSDPFLPNSFNPSQSSLLENSTRNSSADIFVPNATWYSEFNYTVDTTTNNDTSLLTYSNSTPVISWLPNISDSIDTTTILPSWNSSSGVWEYTNTWWEDADDSFSSSSPSSSSSSSSFYNTDLGIGGRKPFDSPQELIFKVSILVLISVFGSVGNFLVIGSIIKTRHLHRPPFYFLLSMAATDLSRAGFCVPVVMATTLQGSRWGHGSSACRLFAFATSFFVFSSSLSLLVISVDRHISIVYSKAYRRRCHGLVNLVVAGLIWVIAFCISFPPVLGAGEYVFIKEESQCVFRHRNHAHSDGVASVMLFIAIAFVTYFLYFRIYRFMRSHRRMRPLQHHPARSANWTFVGPGANGQAFINWLNGFGGQATNRQQTGQRSVQRLNFGRVVNLSLSRNEHLTRLFLTLTLVFGVTWAPYVIVCLWRIFLDEALLPTGFVTSAAWTSYSQVALSPLTYFLARGKVRRSSRTVQACPGDRKEFLLENKTRK